MSWDLSHRNDIQVLKLKVLGTTNLDSGYVVAEHSSYIGLTDAVTASFWLWCYQVFYLYRRRRLKIAGDSFVGLHD